MTPELLHDAAIARYLDAGLLMTGREYLALAAARMATAGDRNLSRTGSNGAGFEATKKAAIDRAKHRRTT